MARKQPDWRNPRPNETIGGGWFVFRRGDSTKRVKPAAWPFEHPSINAARAEALRLAADMPGQQFDILCVLESVNHHDVVSGAYSDEGPHPDDEAEIQAEAADAEHERRRERRAGL